MTFRIIIFLALNFLALSIGAFFTSKGVPSAWYEGLEKAPWTPPGWFFGFAWTTIMICFSLYMAYLWPATKNKILIISLFAIQWILNTGWNPTFFHFHNVTTALITIISLTILIAYFMISNWPLLKMKSLLIAPYLLWLVIAVSLNVYISIKN